METPMRKLTVAEFITLDGVIQSPGDPEEDPIHGFRFGGWIVPYHDDAIDQAVKDLYGQPFELLLGRRTYDIWATYWPKIEAGHPIGDRFNRVPKHVATHRTDTLDWKNSHALEGDLVDAVTTLKAQSGANLLTHGSGDMVRQLLAAGLVDELLLMIYPIMVGHGKRFFGDNALPSALTLAESKTTANGVLITRYKRGGEVRTGSFEPIE